MMVRIRQKWQTWLGTALLANGVVGCQSHGLPQDPLLVSRKPIESKAESAPPVMLAYSEPALPRDPGFALAKQIPARNTKTLPGVLITGPGSDSGSMAVPAALPDNESSPSRKNP